MRYVVVFHSSEPDFVVGIPDNVEDTDLFLDAVLYGADGWTEAESSLRDLMAKWSSKEEEG